MYQKRQKTKIPKLTKKKGMIKIGAVLNELKKSANKEKRIKPKLIL